MAVYYHVILTPAPGCFASLLSWPRVLCLVFCPGLFALRLEEIAKYDSATMLRTELVKVHGKPVTSNAGSLPNRQRQYITCADRDFGREHVVLQLY